MSATETETETTTETNANSSISEGDLRKLIGEELDQRFKDNKPAEINLDEFKSGLIAEVESLLKKERSSSSSSFDADGFFKRVEGMIDGKLSSIGVPVKHRGPLAKWLGL